MLATVVQRERLDPARGGRRTPPALPLSLEWLLSARTADAVFVVAPDYRIVYWDEHAEALTGLLAEEMVGRRCHEALRGESEGGGRLCARGCPVMALARVGRAVSSYDMRIATRVGGRRWVNVSVLSMDSEEGPYLVHFLRDAQRTHEMLEMARSVVALHSGGAASAAPASRGDAPELTPRQAEVLALLASGKSAREIGAELYLSQATVRNHIRALLLALGAHSQLEALAKAREAGLLKG